MSDAQAPREAHAGREDNHHGNTPAAWTTVVIIMIASVVSTLAVILANWPLFWGGLGLAAIGAIIGKAMQAAGYGQPSMARRRS